MAFSSQRGLLFGTSSELNLDTEAPTEAPTAGPTAFPTAISCKELYDAGERNDGEYMILAGGVAVSVSCDMAFGGYTKVLHFNPSAEDETTGGAFAGSNTLEQGKAFGSATQLSAGYLSPAFYTIPFIGSYLLDSRVNLRDISNRAAPSPLGSRISSSLQTSIWYPVFNPDRNHISIEVGPTTDGAYAGGDIRLDFQTNVNTHPGYYGNMCGDLYLAGESQFIMDSSSQGGGGGCKVQNSLSLVRGSGFDARFELWFK